MLKWGQLYTYTGDASSLPALLQLHEYLEPLIKPKGFSVYVLRCNGAPGTMACILESRSQPPHLRYKSQHLCDSQVKSKSQDH